MAFRISKERDKSYEEELRQNELDVIRQDIAEGILNEQQEIEQRKRQLIRESSKLANSGTVVTLTQEMIDLGIEEEIFRMNAEAEISARVRRFFFNHEDDFSEEESNYVDGDFTVSPGHYLQ